MVGCEHPFGLLQPPVLQGLAVGEQRVYAGTVTLPVIQQIIDLVVDSL